MVVSCIHSQLLKPSGASFSTACFLTGQSQSEQNQSSSASTSKTNPFHLNPPSYTNNGKLRSHLVTARDDTISVWEVRVRGNKRRKSNHSQSQLQSDSDVQEGQVAELFHLRTHSLFGSITGLEKVQTIASSEDSRDRILVSFKDAKISLMEWNDAMADLITVSIHTYERAPQLSMGLPLNFKPILSLDPGHRCATLLLPNSSLAILPFFQSTSDLDLYDDDYLKGTSTLNDNLSSHLPYSPSFVLNLNSISSSIVSNNVRDVVFLPGFQKPTLAILCQEQLTWTSSLIDRVDTCSIYMITLDLDLGSTKVGGGVHPILMERKGLPYDSLYLRACPKSIGGVLLVTPSSLIHVDQESNVKGLAVNNWLEHTTKLRLPHWQPRPGEHQARTISTERDGSIDLQNSTLVFPSDSFGDQSTSTSSKGKGTDLKNESGGEQDEEDRKTLKPHPSIALMFLADGTVYSIQLKTEGRFLSGLNLFKLSQHQSLLPSSTISVLPRNNFEEKASVQTYIFCGSLAGEGSLIRVEAGESTPDPELDNEVNGVTNVATSELLHPTQKVEDGMDLDDDLDLYGESTAPSGPAGGGDDLNSSSHPLMSSAFTSPRDYRLERCDTLPALGSIRDLSLMLAREKNEAGEEESYPLAVAATGTRTGGGLTFIEPKIASRSRKALEMESSTAIWALESNNDDAITLSSGTESSSISRLDSLGNISETKSLQGITLAVSSAQISSNGDFVRVSDKSIETISQEGEIVATFSPQSQVVSAVVGRTFCSCILEGGTPLVLKIQSREITSIDSSSFKSSYSSVSIFEDTYGLFRSKSEQVIKHQEPVEESKPSLQDNVQMEEDEEEVDYGDGDLEDEKMTLQDSTSTKLDKESSSHNQKSESFLVLVSNDSTVEIYSLPELKLIWSCATLRFSPAQLESGGIQEGDERIPSVKVVDTCFSLIGGIPHLSVLYEDDLLNVYEASPFSETPSSLSLTFNKVLSRQLTSSTQVPSPPNGSDADQLSYRLSPFNSFGFSEEEKESSNGVAVLGSSPGWIIKSRKGGIAFVESKEDGIESFSSLSLRSKNLHDEARQRFVFTQGGKAFIASFPSYSFDLGLPTRSVTVGRTQTKILGHIASGTVVSAALYDTPWALFDTEDSTMIKDPSSEPAPTYSESGCLELFVDASAEAIHGFEFDFNETVCCMEMLSLKTQSTPSGRKDYIAVGTIVNNGEDRPARGSTYIFDVVEIVAPPDDPACRFALKLICKDESKGPVTALADINGYIITIVAQKLFVRSLESDDWMVTVAFLDVPYQITTVRRLKNFLLLGDVKKSVWFVAFQEEPYRLILLGKDYNEMEITSVNFLLHENEVGFLSTGADGVLRLLEYGPTVPTSQSGQKLLLRTEFQSAGDVSSSLVIPGKPAVENGPSLTSEAILSMTNGSLESVVPIPDVLFNRLQLLQGSLVRSVQHAAGLNPRAFRAVRNETVPRSLTKGILDGTLLQAFESLSRPQMTELSRSLPGCDGPNQILRELAQTRSGWYSI